MDERSSLDLQIFGDNAVHMFKSVGMEAPKQFGFSIIERVKLANHAVTHPDKIDMDHFMNCFIMCCVVFGIIRMLHLVLVKPFFKKEYFALHVLVNVWIVYLCWNDAVNAFLYPTTSTLPNPKTGSSTQFYFCVTLALHIYHPIYFQTGMMDWIHHTPVYILNCLMFSIVGGDNLCFQGIILTGIPGGLDYFLLVLEGEGLLSRCYYKHLSALINNWIRCPFGIIAAYTGLIGLYHHWQMSSTWQATMFICMSLHCFWNVPFFARQTIEANILDTMQRYGMVRNPPSGIISTVNLTNLRILSGVDVKEEKKLSPSTSLLQPASAILVN